MKVIDLVGQQFARLTVLSRAGSQNKKSTWLCRCQCGKEVVVKSDNLKNGNTKSCGCQKRDSTIATMQATKRTHGLSQSAEYRIWVSIKQRCFNPKDAAYPDYGGRGITVCDSWRNSFEAFYADMGARPDPDMSIDRRDVNGHYSPENCRWATQEEQCNNRRNNHLIEHDGQRKTLTQWARAAGLHPNTIRLRLRNGWTMEEAMIRRRATL